MATTSHFESMLREVSLRVTRPRVAVLTAVHEHPHADTDSIIGMVRADLGEVSHQAVYDVLRALTTAGLVRRLQPEGSVARYEARVGKSVGAALGRMGVPSKRDIQELIGQVDQVKRKVVSRSRKRAA